MRMSLATWKLSVGIILRVMMMANHSREIAGFGIFVCAAMLIYQGKHQEALYLILPTVAFFIGERNGERKKDSKT